ncbi:hypothetical protein [Komagataeibacter sp. FNDCF1]|uniref:hypothetical protein n=1 Tax=Komagataeibacter sp. FNDCF1 TaxID=2878681 RepID=UPI001E4FFD97|nr:hypothetical protein [Komagataeibacter sp. FNDCF1]MCE2564517.1 hypothetical protein [Komagataeibacter sp. FNDCF1]
MDAHVLMYFFIYFIFYCHHLAGWPQVMDQLAGQAGQRSRALPAGRTEYFGTFHEGMPTIDSFEIVVRRPFYGKCVQYPGYFRNPEYFPEWKDSV